MLDTFAERLSAVALLGAAFMATSVAAAPAGATQAARSGAAVGPTVIDGRIWRCSETACTASAASGADSQPATRECARAAEALGPFTAYETGDRVLTADQLARCNARAPSSAGALIARR